MQVLLTNDDGIHAGGLHALYRRFSAMHNVIVVAPDRQRSAVSHSITLHKPIRCDRVCLGDNGFGYAVSGTPADCVKLAVLELMDSPPDLVVSGINPGANIGFNVNYSGTVCAAREAGGYGIPAIAVSVSGGGARHGEAAAFVEAVAQWILSDPISKGIVLNINIPDIPFDKIQGVRVTRLEMQPVEERFERRTDPRNRTYYWQECERRRTFSGPDTDGAALSEDWISMTPIRCDLTDHRALQRLKRYPFQVQGGDGR